MLQSDRSMQPSIPSADPGRVARRTARLLLAVAIVVVVAVIPAILADGFAGATPRRASSAFAVLAGIDAITALSLWRAAARASGLAPWQRVVTILVAAVLTLALLDAMFALTAHGPSMRLTQVVLLSCAVAETGAALLLAAPGRRTGT